MTRSKRGAWLLASAVLGLAALLVAVDVFDGPVDGDARPLPPMEASPTAPLASPGTASEALPEILPTPAPAPMGFIVDASGSGVRDAAIFVLGETGQNHDQDGATWDDASARASASQSTHLGYFELPKPDQAFAIVKAGFAPLVIEPTGAADPSQACGFQLRPGGEVRGRFLHRERSPASAVRVALSDARSAPGSQGRAMCSCHQAAPVDGQLLEQLLRTESDGEGAFSVPIVPYGDYTLSWWREERTKANAEITVGADLLDLGEISLTRPLMIHGLVADTAGTPLPGAVVITRALSPDAGGSIAQTTTDETGRFSLTGLAGMRHSLHAAASGHGWQHISEATASPSGDEVLLTMPDPRRVSVAVVAADSRLPIPDAELVVNLTAPLDWLPEVDGVLAVQQSAGSWHVLGLGSSLFDVTAKHPGYSPSTVTAGPIVVDDATISMSLTRFPALRCLVVDSFGTPLVGADVQIAYRGEALGVDRTTRLARTGPSGEASMTDLAAGPWAFWVSENGYHSTTTLQLDTPRDLASPILVELTPFSTVVGSVTAAEGVRAARVPVVLVPVPGAHAERRSWGGVPIFARSVLRTRPSVTESDDEGSFRFEEVAAGEWMLFASRTDLSTSLKHWKTLDWNQLANGAVHLDVQPGEIEDHTLALEDLGATLHGRLVGNWTPPGEARVSVWSRLDVDSHASWIRLAEQQVDEDGYLIEGLPAGAGWLVFDRGRSTGPELQAYELRDGDHRRLDVHEPPATWINGVVLLEDSMTPAPPGSVRVSAMPSVEPDHELAEIYRAVGGPLLTADLQSRGQFSFRGLEDDHPWAFWASGPMHPSSRMATVDGSELAAPITLLVAHGGKLQVFAGSEASSVTVSTADSRVLGSAHVRPGDAALFGPYPVGPVSVLLTLPHGIVETREVTVTAGETLVIEL